MIDSKTLQFTLIQGLAGVLNEAVGKDELTVDEVIEAVNGFAVYVGLHAGKKLTDQKQWRDFMVQNYVNQVDKNRNFFTKNFEGAE